MSTKYAIKKLAVQMGTLILFLAFLIATYGLFAIGGFQLALKTREVIVPNLTGLTPQEAQLALADIALGAKIDPSRRIHPTIEPGLVVSQEPNPSLTTRRRRNVRLWLSSGLTPSSIPVLIGASETSARKRLEENAFALNYLSEIKSKRFQTDAIVAQTPSTKDRGQNVSLLINRGERERTYVMPDLIGVNGSIAEEILRTSGFRVTVVGEHPYANVPPGIVLRQSPQAGFQIAPGESISLEVSQ